MNRDQARSSVDDFIKKHGQAEPGGTCAPASAPAPRMEDLKGGNLINYIAESTLTQLANNPAVFSKVDFGVANLIISRPFIKGKLAFGNAIVARRKALEYKRQGGDDSERLQIEVDAWLKKEERFIADAIQTFQTAEPVYQRKDPEQFKDEIEKCWLYAGFAYLYVKQWGKAYAVFQSRKNSLDAVFGLQIAAQRCLVLATGRHDRAEKAQEKMEWGNRVKNYQSMLRHCAKRLKQAQDNREHAFKEAQRALTAQVQRLDKATRMRTQGFVSDEELAKIREKIVEAEAQAQSLRGPAISAEALSSAETFQNRLKLELELEAADNIIALTDEQALG